MIADLRVALLPDNDRVTRSMCHARYVRSLRWNRKQAQCLGMMNFAELPPVPSDRLVAFTDQLRLTVTAYLARFKGSSREHTESRLRPCETSGIAE